MKLCITTKNENETYDFGVQIGALLKGGEIIELISDVGGGKTTLTKGIVSGLGSVESVTSPTFTVSKVYTARGIELHHYDFYRLGKIGLLSEELQEVINDSKSIAVIEWAGETHESLPKDRLITVEIQLEPNSESSRKLIINTSDRYSDWAQELEVTAC
jgi:tRNA threonylcarbamoyladenosine biosynthesis protein TsaE